MALAERPYAGTWIPGNDSVDIAPDAIVEINGSSIITACPRCGTKVDVNRYVTEISVEAGVEPGGASASFTMSLPPELQSKDGRTLIPRAVEVEIYMRGYFPARGLYTNLAPSQRGAASGAPGSAGPGASAAVADTAAPAERPEDALNITDKGNTFRGRARRLPPNQIVIHESQTESAEETVSVLERRHLSVHYTVDQDGSITRLLQDNRAGAHAKGNNNRSIGVEVTNPLYGKEALPNQKVIKAPWAHTGTYAVPPPEQAEASWNLARRTAADNQIPLQFPAEQGDSFRMTEIGREQASKPGIISHENWGDHADGSFLVLYMSIRNRGYSPDEAYARAVDGAQKGTVVDLPPRVDPPKTSAGTIEAAQVEARQEAPAEEVIAYPYYHVFRGVVTDVTETQQEGSASLSIQCQSLLHFWQYEVISANAALQASRPSGSGLRISLLGHNLTGRHPYQIIYELHQDILGAAAGVNWVLDQKTNRNAATDAGQYYSLARMYWQQRFARREVKLRMHGLRGELFSALQSAFLARTPTEQLRDIMRERDASARLRRQRGTGLMNQAVTLGLLTTPKTEPRPKFKSPIELNLAEMQAFVSNISNWGQVNQFESAYESKLDVVHRVCELTGFEFYQDVDGDFVFKPPLYNLDTSSSRPYRIEPEDLLTMSLQDHEPQVTYATVRGSRFDNVQGHGVEGEWGIQGQYIDYRLVAEYGWRPLDIETAYLTDKRSVFYLAAAQVDQHAAMASAASATIPLRPEVRPGYPFYVRNFDCFYYCRGISHSWTYGGQCSTTLTLVARREAFHAPGTPGTKGLAAISLGDGNLPPRPLIASTQDGDIQVAGFPNVVMALDPDHIDPSVLRLGGGFNLADDPLVLRSMLETAVLKRVAARTEDGDYAVDVPDGHGGSRRVVFSLSGKGAAGAIDARAAASQLAKKRRSTTAEREKLEQQLRDAQFEAAKPAGPDGSSGSEAASKRVSALRSRLREMDARVLDADQGSDASLLYQALLRVGEGDLIPGGPGDERGARALALLRVLSDRKGSFLSDKVPGYYRYYSASHPDPEQQGPPTSKIEIGPDGRTSFTRAAAILDPKWSGTKVQGFLPAKKGRAEVERATVRPVRGVRVLMADDSRPGGEVVPTSQILEVVFSATDLYRGVPVREGIPVFTSRNDEAAYERFSRSALASAGDKAVPGQTSRDVFMDAWVALQAEVVYAWAAAKAAHGPEDLTPLQPPPFPEEVRFGKLVISGTSRADWTPEKAADTAQFLAAQFAAQVMLSIQLWGGAIEDRGLAPAACSQLLSTLQSHLRSRFGATGSATAKAEVTSSKNRQELIESPVFPVSDGKGYRVVGTFRYGRGLDIAADGAWAALRRQDPLSMLSRASIERVLDEVVQAGKNPAVDLAQEIARQLRDGFTDAQLLDLGLARRKPGADQLEIGLLNWFADGREGIAKIPAQNTAAVLSALSLADIGSAPSVCACTTPDLDFPNLAADADAAAISQALLDRADQAVPTWRAAQDAVRGAKTPNKVPLTEGLQQAAQAITSLAANLERTVPK